MLTYWFCFWDLEVYCCFAVLVGPGLHIECRDFSLLWRRRRRRRRHESKSKIDLME